MRALQHGKYQNRAKGWGCGSGEVVNSNVDFLLMEGYTRDELVVVTPARDYSYRSRDKVDFSSLILHFIRCLPYPTLWLKEDGAYAE